VKPFSAIRQSGIAVAALFVLFALLLAGCYCCEPDKQSLAVWHSPDTTLIQRVEAARQLVPTRTSQEKAGHILGQPSYSLQYYGPVFYAPDSPYYEGATNLAWCNIRKDYYDFTNGDYVALNFDMGPPGAPRKTLKLLSIWIGSTNVNTFNLSPWGK
jgi:hypothetical protein